MSMQAAATKSAGRPEASRTADTSSSTLSSSSSSRGSSSRGSSRLSANAGHVVLVRWQTQGKSPMRRSLRGQPVGHRQQTLRQGAASQPATRQQTASCFTTLAAIIPWHACCYCTCAAGVIFNLGMLTEMVLANHCNCQRLCVLGQDVLAVLDNAGERGGSSSSSPAAPSLSQGRLGVSLARHQGSRAARRRAAVAVCWKGKCGTTKSSGCRGWIRLLKVATQGAAWRRSPRGRHQQAPATAVQQH